MSNVNSKEHLFVMVQGPNGPERREVKRRQEDHKLYDKMKAQFELEARKSKRLK